MEQRPTIVTLTMNPAIDASMEVDRVEPEAKLRCGEPRFDPGGGGINVARVATALGCLAAAVYPAGGHTGDLLEDLVGELGLDGRRIHIERPTRTNTTVVEREGGRQFRFNVPGPELTPRERDACLSHVQELLTEGTTLVLSGSLPRGVAPAFYGQVIDAARRRSARVVADTSGEALRAVAGQGVSLLKPNLRELAQLLETDRADPATAGDDAARLVERGVADVVVVSMGSDGAWLASREGRWRAESPDVKVRSAIGAGDCMVAALAIALAEGATGDETLRQGVAAGSAAVLTEGTGLLEREAYERLLRKVKVREA